MTDKPLDPADRALLDIIAETHARIGRVERDQLNVEARGRGIEVGRALAALKDAGLVEETETRPGFFGRLFGARPKVLLRPVNTEAPAAAPAPETAASEPAAVEPTPTEAAAPVAEEAPPEAPAVTEPAVTETALPEAEAPAAEIAVIETVVSVTETVTDIAAQTVESVTETVIVETAPTEPAPEPAAEPAAQPVPATPRPAQTPRPHFALDDYTDKVGGGDAIEVGPAAIDPEEIDSLRETLAELGMDLTMAGEALIADRMAKGESAGDALSQVVLFAFAHAVHYDLLSGGGMQALGLTDYAIEVMKELEKLRDAGVIGPERFESDMRRLWSFVGEDGELMRANRAAELLTDPVGGAAPPATLPEDLQAVDDPDDED
ncbi:hypothetical protein [Paenirhodobacter enshiensis]|uniref:hypothetical protein n=1 Tax=Paenirhodobacter enshiensis TaxID=1105367 RepID=UPI0035AF74A6